MRSSPGKGTSRPLLKKKVTWAYFSVSATCGLVRGRGARHHLAEDVLGGGRGSYATGRPNSASYSVRHTKDARSTTFFRSRLPANRSAQTPVIAFVISRARSARKIEEDHRVTVTNRRAARDQCGLYELIIFAAGVSGFDGLGCALGFSTLATHHCLVRPSDAIPAIVAVHREKAADHAGEVGAAGLDVGRQGAHVFESRARWRVAAVEEGVDRGFDFALSTMSE